jgi:hypothetical protein
MSDDAADFWSIRSQLSFIVAIYKALCIKDSVEFFSPKTQKAKGLVECILE